MTTPPDTADLLRRIERLEARLGAVLEVPRLRVMGARGKPVIEMGSSPDGEPEIVLLDALGRDRILLRLVENESALEFLAEDGRPQFRAAGAEGSTRVVLWTEGDPPRRAELRVGSDGTACVAVVEGRERVRALFGVSAGGDAVVRCDPPSRAESGSGDEA
jgi:hypothetical protein